MDMAVDSSGSAYVVVIHNGAVYLKEPGGPTPGVDVLSELGVAGNVTIVDVACAFLPGGNVLQLRGVDPSGTHYFADRIINPPPGPNTWGNRAPIYP